LILGAAVLILAVATRPSPVRFSPQFLVIGLACGALALGANLRWFSTRPPAVRALWLLGYPACLALVGVGSATGSPTLLRHSVDVMLGYVAGTLVAFDVFRLWRWLEWRARLRPAAQQGLRVHAASAICCRRTGLSAA